MRNYLALLLCLVSYLIGNAQETNAINNPKDELKGVWTVDLRPSPDAEAYYQKFTVTAISGNTFKGSFYGSPIDNGLINDNWEKLYFAFITRDASSEYYHSGYIENGVLYGISYCPDRTFTAPWKGTKE
jgi:hypothetical protein